MERKIIANVLGEKSRILFVLTAFILVSLTFSVTKPDSKPASAEQRQSSSVPRQETPDIGSRDAQAPIEEKAGVTEVYHQTAGKTVTVVIDAGHGGIDGGTSYNGIDEKDISLDIALRMGEFLRLPGINVLFTRDYDEYLSLKQRITFANKAGADLFVSVHVNALEDDASVHGTETLYYTSKESGKKPFNSKIFAEIVQDELVKSLETRDDGIVYRKGLGVIEYTKMPSVIAEVGYITNPYELLNLQNPKFREKAAAGLANAVIRALNLQSEGQTEPSK